MKRILGACLLVLPMLASAEDDCLLICDNVPGLCDPVGKSRCDSDTNTCKYLYLDDDFVFAYSKDKPEGPVRPVLCSDAKQMLGVYLIHVTARQSRNPAGVSLRSDGSVPPRDPPVMNVFGSPEAPCTIS